MIAAVTLYGARLKLPRYPSFTGFVWGNSVFFKKNIYSGRGSNQRWTAHLIPDQKKAAVQSMAKAFSESLKS